MELERARLLFEIYRSESGLDVYTLYRRLRISPLMLDRVSRPLIKEGLIQISETTLTLTEKGIAWLIQNRNRIQDGRSKPWRMIPDHFVEQKLAVTSPYIPSVSRLDRLYFNLPKPETDEE